MVAKFDLRASIGRIAAPAARPRSDFVCMCLCGCMCTLGARQGLRKTHRTRTLLRLNQRGPVPTHECAHMSTRDSRHVMMLRPSLNPSTADARCQRMQECAAAVGERQIQLVGRYEYLCSVILRSAATRTTISSHSLPCLPSPSLLSHLHPTYTTHTPTHLRSSASTTQTSAQGVGGSIGAATAARAAARQKSRERDRAIERERDGERRRAASHEREVRERRRGRVREMVLTREERLLGEVRPTTLERERVIEMEREREAVRARESEKEKEAQRQRLFPTSSANFERGARGMKGRGGGGLDVGGSESLLREMLQSAKSRERALVLQVATLQAENERLIECRKENLFRSQYVSEQIDSAQRCAQKDAFCRERLDRDKEKLHRQLAETRQKLHVVMGSVRSRISEVEEMVSQRYLAAQAPLEQIQKASRQVRAAAQAQQAKDKANGSQVGCICL